MEKDKSGSKFDLLLYSSRMEHTVVGMDNDFWIFE